MKTFHPSVAFLQYYEAVMAAANGPISPGMYHVTIPMPSLIDVREQAFAVAKLAPLIDAINLYRDSVPSLSGTTSTYVPTAADYGGGAP